MVKDFLTPLLPGIPFQMCVQRKKPEVFIMFLRGDNKIKVPLLF
jgi:hypothetical protein